MQCVSTAGNLHQQQWVCCRGTQWSHWNLCTVRLARDNRTVIRSQRREVLQSASIMVSSDWELWPSSTGTDHAEEDNWRQANQLVFPLSPPRHPRPEEISPTYKFMLNNSRRGDCDETNHDKTSEEEGMSSFAKQITALTTTPLKQWEVHISYNNFTQ